MSQEDIALMIGEAADLFTQSAAPVSERLSEIIDAFCACLKSDGKIILAGNGGSAAQAVHIAAEFTGRYKMERRALPAIALTADISALTAISNDYGYDVVFSRQLEALGSKGDIFVGLSTSGNSKNIVQAVDVCKERGITCVLLLGKDGGVLKGQGTFEIVVDSSNTPRIQEMHLTMLHIICEIVEKRLFT